jgi:hypothetical protein
VANKLFGRELFGRWKPFQLGEPQDQYTLPASSSTVKAEHLMESAVLSKMAQEMMSYSHNPVVHATASDGLAGKEK